MFRTIENITKILDESANGKLFESRKKKRWRRSGVKDLVSISDEARQRCGSDGEENTTPREDDMYFNYKGAGGR
jgi:hypothetical protein